MKYTDICVLVPFYENGYKNWHKLKLEGTLSEHRVHREIKRFCRREYGITPDPIFLKHECIYYQPYGSVPSIAVNNMADSMMTFLQDEHEALINEQTGTDQLPEGQVT